MHIIDKDGLERYCKGQPYPKIRLFTKGGPPHEMVDDFFLYKDGDGDNANFIIDIWWLEYGGRYILRTGDIIGLEEKNMIGFEPRRVVL